MNHVLKSRILFRNLRFKESEEVSKATPASIDLSLTSRIFGQGAPFMIIEFLCWGLMGGKMLSSQSPLVCCG